MFENHTEKILDGLQNPAWQSTQSEPKSTPKKW